MHRRSLTQKEQDILKTYAPRLFAQYKTHSGTVHNLKYFLVRSRLKLPPLTEQASKRSLQLPLTPPTLPSSLLAELSSAELFSGQTETYSRGSSKVHAVYCSQELAFEVLQRKYAAALKAEYGLQQVHYDGDAFILVSCSAKAVCRAGKRLTQLLNCLIGPRLEPINTGSSEDLVGVPYSEEIEYTGSRECIFCSNLCELGQIVRRTPCLHIFHMNCIEKWLVTRQVCPIDKMPLKSLE